jgi:hypothetical protein
MMWVRHVCHECKIKFLKAKDYLLHYNDHHIDYHAKIKKREIDQNP